MGLGTAGAGPVRSSWEGLKSLVEKGPVGSRYQNFHEGFECKVEGIGYLSPASPFLILEASVVLSGLPRREKAVASASGADPKGLDAAPGRLASWCWGRGKEVLLAPPFALARRAPSG